MSTRTVLVTGGNRGIGRAIVEGLAKMNELKILLGCRSLDQGEALARQTAGDVVAVALDLGTRDGMKKQMAAIFREHGPVDVLINNAGILEEGDVLQVAEEAFDRSIRVNMTAAFDLIRMVAPGMAERGYGRIVNVSSGWGSFEEGLTGPAAYSISKAALNALTKTANRALDSCIKINSMCPGWVRTDMGGQNATRSPEEGADTAIWLATLPDDGPSGGFFRDRSPIDW